MDPRAAAFLESVLGPLGARALIKAAEAAPALRAVLVPRAALGWVAAVGEYDGEVPGLPGTRYALRKAEGGYRGLVAGAGVDYAFLDAPLERAAAALLAALGPAPAAPSVQGPPLERLGKAVDQLVRARAGLGKAAPKAPAAAGAGPAAAQRPPQAPQGPTAVEPTKQFSGAKKRPRLPQLRVTKAEARHPCPACARSQFRGDAFAGCACFAPLAKAVAVEVLPGGYGLTLGAGWTTQDVVTLLEDMGR